MMGKKEIPDELIDQLLGEYEGPEQLTGPAGKGIAGTLPTAATPADAAAAR